MGLGEGVREVLRFLKLEVSTLSVDEVGGAPLVEALPFFKGAPLGGMGERGGSWQFNLGLREEKREGGESFSVQQFTSSLPRASLSPNLLFPSSFSSFSSFHPHFPE